MRIGIVSVDLHGKNKFQAKVAIDAQLRRAGNGVYRIRLIHGCHGGTVLRDMIRDEYASHPKVRRLESAINNGSTDLVLREF